LRHWRFKPAMLDGKPVESWKVMTVRFEMTA
jgi:protein TonB